MTESEAAPNKVGILAEFRDFLLRGNVVDLAVAVVVGAAAAAVVRSLVTDLISPLIGLIIGQPNFSDLSFTIGSSVFHYGAFLDAVIAFITIVAAIFFLVIKPTEKLATLTGTAPDPGPSEVELLAEIRDLLKSERG